MNKQDKADFKFDKPKKCAVSDCKNKPYGKNRLTLDVYEWVCLKHHRIFNLGWSTYEATRGKKIHMTEVEYNDP